MKQKNNIIERVENVLIASGFKNEVAVPKEYLAALSTRNMIRSLVFMMQVVDDDKVDNTKVNEIVDRGRQWCTKSLNARWFSKECGLNLVLFHKGQIQLEAIKQQIDKTGLHGTICQSITAINMSNTDILQERIWIVVGKVKKALVKLAEIKEI